MTTGKTTSASVICEEVFDDICEPSAEEINEHAIKIGIDPEKEPQLLHLAKEGLMQALPSDWKICYNDKLHAHYYYNEKTKASQWDHPLDAVYRKIVEENREKLKNKSNQQVNAIDISEDVSQIDSGIRSLQANEDSDVNTNDTPSIDNFKMSNLGNRFLEGRNKKLSGLDPIKNSRFEVIKTNPQIGLSMKINAEREEATTNARNVEDFMGKKGFTISGTGAMFLKSNIKKGEGNATLTAMDRSRNYFTETLNVKGILRDSSLTDVRKRFDEMDSEDKKSVRFNLDEIKSRPNYSPEEDQSSSRKLGLSPEVSDNSDDDDDPWDFMEDEPEEEKHIKEIKVVPLVKNSPSQLLKPLLKSQLSSDHILVKPQVKLANMGRTFSADSVGEKSNSSLLDKINDQSNNLVKPLYDDSDSDSRDSSVRSFIQKPSEKENFSSIDAQNTEMEHIKLDHERQLEMLHARLKNEREVEETRLKDEIQKMLAAKKEELLKKVEDESALADVEQTKISLRTTAEKTITEEKTKIDAEINEIIQKYRAEKETQHKELLEMEEDNMEKHFQKAYDELKTEKEDKLENIRAEYDAKLEDIKRTIEEEQNHKLEEYRIAIQEEYHSKRQQILNEHKSTVDVLQKNHAETVQELERDLKSEKEILKKEHLTNLSVMRNKLSHELEMEKQRMRETGEDRLYEKVRCEKRLLEDKYRCLKEKYIRLKTDVRITLERRHRRREQQAAQQMSLTTTGSATETDRSISNKPSIGNSENRSASLSAPYTDQTKPPLTMKNQINIKEHIRDKSAERPQLRERKLGIPSKYIKQIQSHYQDDTTSISHSDNTISNNYPKGKYLPAPYSDNGNSDSEAFRRNQENNNYPRDRQRKKLFSRMKSASTSRLNSENFKIDRPCTPVENLRRQLQKLEDLEDQFPDNTLDTTYHLRYPFSDISNEHAGTSSELEFFKHRIHLERDSVRRAKESLRTQRTNFRARQREIKQRHKVGSTRHTLDQLIQEEKELTEMEVNLHRTRALLGEKVIRLRHLEQSLQRICEKEKPIDYLHVENKDDTTLSDLSSHSSSGFSSTDFASDTNQANINRRKEVYQESSECIQNLEILNAEIREILDILGKQQPNGLPATPQILHTDLSWSILSPNIQSSNNISPLLHAPQSIPTLADRLETYRQLAAGRVQTSVGGAILAANTIVSQSPRALNYTTSLVERTRDLRNWLRQAKNEHEILSTTNIASNISPGAGPQTNL